MERRDEEIGREYEPERADSGLNGPNEPSDSVFQRLHKWGRGAIGKTLLLAASIGGGMEAAPAPVQGAERVAARRVIENDTAKPHLVGEDGILYSVKVYDKVLKADRMWYVRQLPGALESVIQKNDLSPGVYYCSETDEYYFKPLPLPWSKSKRERRLELLVNLPSKGELEPSSSEKIATFDKIFFPHKTTPQEEKGKGNGLPPPNNAPVKTAVPQASPSSAEKVKSGATEDAEIEEAKEAVEALGILTIPSPDLSNPHERALTLPSLVPPEGYDPKCIVIEAVVEDGKRGTAVLPCVRHFGDLVPVGVLGVRIETSSGSQLEPKSVKIIQSVKTPKNRYDNPYVEVEVGSNRDTNRALKIMVSILALVPRYPAESNVLEAIDDNQVPTIKNALETAASIKWSLKTDCGYKARCASELAPEHIQPTSGYTDDSKPSNAGHRHCINVVKARSKDGGEVLFTADARALDNLYTGSLHGFFPTEVGNENVLPHAGGLHVASNGTNGGIFFGLNMIKPASLVSCKEMRMPPTAEARKKIAPLVHYANLLWQKRMLVYKHPDKLALGE